MTSTPESTPTPEPASIDATVAQELALAALREITPAATIGDSAGSSVDADGVLTLRFENRLPGYPGWFWTVGIAQVEDAAPTVLEAELMPGDGALTAPDWLPWAERLAEYQAAQAALAAEGLETEDLDISDDDDEDLDDVEDLDAADFDNDGSPILHSGDVDGVDIDELSDDALGESIDEDSDDDADDEEDLDDFDDDDFDDDHVS
ncbi:hypothetical protein BH10ACT5_BH10ACT5_05760 [soil metagenome]